MAEAAQNFPAVDGWLRSFPEIKDTDYTSFWKFFQSLHDASLGEPYYFKSRLTRFLEEYNLSTDFVKDLDFTNWKADN